MAQAISSTSTREASPDGSDGGLLVISDSREAVKFVLGSFKFHIGGWRSFVTGFGMRIAALLVFVWARVFIFNLYFYFCLCSRRYRFQDVRGAG